MERRERNWEAVGPGRRARREAYVIRGEGVGVGDGWGLEEEEEEEEEGFVGIVETVGPVGTAGVGATAGRGTFGRILDGSRHVVR